MSETPMSHPSALQLDAFAVGHGNDAVRAHLSACPSCSKYVDEIVRGTESFAKNEPALAKFTRDIRNKPDVHDKSDVHDKPDKRDVPDNPDIHDIPSAATVRERCPSATPKKASNRRAWAAGIGSALALAAGLLLFVHGPPPDSPALLEGPIRFKGGTQVAVIVDHAGTQSRKTGAVDAEVGDGIRLEMAFDHDERIAAGVLADDGEWAELQPPSALMAGTHYSEQSVHFENDVPRGWILVGPVDSVDKARRTRDFRDIVAIRLQPKVPLIP